MTDEERAERIALLQEQLPNLEAKIGQAVAAQATFMDWVARAAAGKRAGTRQFNENSYSDRKMDYSGAEARLLSVLDRLKARPTLPDGETAHDSESYFLDEEGAGHWRSFVFRSAAFLTASNEQLDALQAELIGYG